MSSSSSSESKLATAKTVISTIGSVTAAAMVVRSLARDYLPPELHNHLTSTLRTFINKYLSRQLTMVINELDDGYVKNEIYTAAKLYLAAQVSTQTQLLQVTKNPSDKNIHVSMDIYETFTDVYNGVKFTWCFFSKTSPPSRDDVINGSGGRSVERWFELTFHRKHRELAVNDYLPFVINDSKIRKQKEKNVKLFTVYTGSGGVRVNGMWTPVNLSHPATFDTLAMDGDVKEMVMKDLDRFVERREYYRKVGKAWKRGYLLYGPPGTGKSSLIAAMANYLKFDIYDLELTAIKSNSELRKVLVTTANRSILVVEDIDCSVELHDRADAQPVVAPTAVAAWRGQYSPELQRVTLSGFLNFIDGLWSSCGDERIIIFTTNSKEKLDPALLRPGRMDVHIHMSYCTPCGFRLLASNYLGISEHERFEEIEELIRKVEITPAEVAEQLLKDGDPDIALGGLVEFFDVKGKENEETKAKTLAKANNKIQLAAKESEEKQVAN